MTRSVCQPAPTDDGTSSAIAELPFGTAMAPASHDQGELDELQELELDEVPPTKTVCVVVVVTVIVVVAAVRLPEDVAQGAAMPSGADGRKRKDPAVSPSRFLSARELTTLRAVGPAPTARCGRSRRRRRA
jgi:hypothetical protein